MERASLRTINKGIGVIEERKLNQKSFSDRMKHKRERRVQKMVLISRESDSVMASAGEYDDKVMIEKSYKYSNNNSGIDIPQEKWGFYPYILTDRIIVSFTSWKQRIQYAAHTVDLMLRQTVKPYKIILNLSSDEFPEKEKELPKNLLRYLQTYVFEINWVKENTKAYKKIIPTMDMYPDDVIISIDDDVEYPANFIQEMYKRFIDNGKVNPVSAGSEKCRWDNDIYTHHGAFSLVKKDFFGSYLDDLVNNLVKAKGYDNFILSDMVYTYAALLNGHRYTFHLDSINMAKLRAQNAIGKNNPLSDFSANHRQQLMKQHVAVRNYIYKKYNKEYDDLLDANIIVNLTTWYKRDWCLYPMLKEFQKQTLKPDRIILWLSHEEYDQDNLPSTIKKCLDNKLLTDIMWVDKNVYCHKRFECFRHFNDCYNIFVDDDTIYPDNFVEEIVRESKKHQDCITVHSTNSCDYSGNKIIKKKIDKHPSHRNVFMGGRCCFPPYIMPKDVLDFNTDLRDKYVTKCDESWTKPFLIKHDIKIFAIHDWDKNIYKEIDDTQDVSLYGENKQIDNDGMREKERNFFNAIKITHTEDLCKKVWPRIGIDKYKIH